MKVLSNALFSNKISIDEIKKSFRVEHVAADVRWWLRMTKNDKSPKYHNPRSEGSIVVESLASFPHH